MDNIPSQLHQDAVMIGKEDNGNVVYFSTISPEMIMQKHPEDEYAELVDPEQVALEDNYIALDISGSSMDLDISGYTNPDLHRRIEESDTRYYLRIHGKDSYRTVVSADDNSTGDESCP